VHLREVADVRELDPVECRRMSDAVLRNVPWRLVPLLAPAATRR
jgi:hypothetical protein